MKKTIIIGVTSSIAAFKSVQLTSDLIKKGYDVEVIMSKNATAFIQPLTFSSLTKHKTYVETFDREVDYSIEHISLAKRADVFIIAPASANVIAKVAHGICDDMLTTTFLAANCPKLIAPAMNTQMWENPITQDNINLCRQYGMSIIQPTSGRLACEDVGAGKLANQATLMDAIEQALHTNKVFAGKKIMISAGATIESIDPVRYITNRSSGKMGYALARAARNLGAEVTLLSGPCQLDKIEGITTIAVQTTKQMFEEAKALYPNMDFIICAAAPADYTMQTYSEHKIKKAGDTLTLQLTRNPDILAYLGAHKTKQKICGFAAESQNAIENAKQKFIHKNCDLMVVNNILQEGAGFQGDTNIVSILTKDEIQHYDKMNKEQLAYLILDALYKQ